MDALDRIQRGLCGVAVLPMVKRDPPQAKIGVRIVRIELKHLVVQFPSGAPAAATMVKLGELEQQRRAAGESAGDPLQKLQSFGGPILSDENLRFQPIENGRLG